MATGRGWEQASHQRGGQEPGATRLRRADLGKWSLRRHRSADGIGDCGAGLQRHRPQGLRLSPRGNAACRRRCNELPWRHAAAVLQRLQAGTRPGFQVPPRQDGLLPAGAGAAVRALSPPGSEARVLESHPPPTRGQLQEPSLLGWARARTVVGKAEGAASSKDAKNPQTSVNSLI